MEVFRLEGKNMPDQAGPSAPWLEVPKVLLPSFLSPSTLDSRSRPTDYTHRETLIPRLHSLCIDPFGL